MHVPFTHKILKDWAGAPTFQKGMTLFEKGKVEKVQYDHPFITGQLAIGVRGMRSKFEVLKDGFTGIYFLCTLMVAFLYITTDGDKQNQKDSIIKYNFYSMSRND